MKLRYRLPLVIFGFSFIPMLLVGLVVQRYVRQMAWELDTSYVSSNAAIQARMIRDRLDAKGHRLTGIRDEVQRPDAPPEDLTDPWFLALVNPGPFPMGALGVGVYNTDGFLVNQSGKVSFPRLQHGLEFLARDHKERVKVSDSVYLDEDLRYWLESYPLTDQGGAYRGLLIRALAVPSPELDSLVKPVLLGKTGYAYVVDQQGFILSHPDAARPGTITENEALSDLLATIRQGFVTDYIPREYTYRGVAKVLAWRPVENTRLVMAVVKDQEEVLATMKSLNQLLVGLLVMVVIAALVASLQVLRQILDPVDRIVRVTQEVSEGSFDRFCQIPGRDEISQLGNGIDRMIENLHRSLLELERQDNELKRTESRYRLSLDAVRDAVWEYIPDRDLIVFSGQIKRLLGGNAPLEMPLEVLERDYLHPEDMASLSRLFEEFMAGNETQLRFELRARAEDGRECWLLIRGTHVRDPYGKTFHLLGSCSDISEQRFQETRIRQLAFFDPLTKLPNRQSFMDSGGMILRHERHSREMSLVAMINIDRFRRINDSFGYPFGDGILQKFSARLDIMARKMGGTLYRYGGDSFVLIIPGVDSELDARIRVKDFMQKATGPVEVDGRQIHCTFCLGATLYPRDAQSPQDLLRTSDSALNVARDHGAGSHAFYDVSMRRDIQQRLHVESQLRLGLAEGRLVQHYQPIFRLDTGAIAGFEALSRLRGNDDLPISPMEFIPVAEETGLILDLGRHVLDNAAQQAFRWKQKGLDFGFIGVNVSFKQLESPGFVEHVAMLLSSYHLAPASLEIEVTESAYMENPDLARKVLGELRDLGLGVALDDFGTGYSSLATLARIPCQKIKMDHGFITHMDKDARSLSLAQAIFSMARSLDLLVVAEGVERVDQVDYLRGLGVPLGQGFLVAQAMEAVEAERYLRKDWTPALPWSTAR